MTTLTIADEASQREVPACVLWPIPDTSITELPEWDAVYDHSPRISWWQAGRCGICNHTEQWRNLDFDHSYVTGLYRGYLCRGCNMLEGRGLDHQAFVLWRTGWNPAALLGVHRIKRTRGGAPLINEDGRRLRMTHAQRRAYDAANRQAMQAGLDALDAAMEVPA